MLQTIHDKLKGLFAIVILVALGVVFVFWGVDVSVGSFTRARGVEVNGREIPVTDIEQTYQDQLSRYQVAFGAAGVPEEMQEALRRDVIEQAVRAELVRQRTRELDFQTTDAQVLAAIRQVPAFQVEGQFSPDAYHAALSSINMSPERFEEEQRQLVLARQLDRGISSSAFVLPSELERAVALRHESRTLGWVVVPAERFEPEVQVSDAELQAYYEANRARFMTDEKATVDYIELDIDAFAEAAQVDEAQLRAYYEENRARYSQAGRRRARHILVEEGGDAAAAEAEAARAAERARAGEDFAALARELSDDAGSRDQGGDLGFAERGDLDPAFADALWDLGPGEIAGPVRSSFGWHVIKLEAVDEEKLQPFEEVRAELEPEFRRMQVEKEFGDAQEELDTLAFESAGDIAAVATKVGRPVRRIEGFTRSGAGALGANAAVTEAVFSPEVIAGRELRTVELGPGRVVALGVSAHEPARLRPLDEVRAEVLAGASRKKAEEIAAKRAGELVAELAAGAGWSRIAAGWPDGAETAEPRPVRRDDAGVPAEVRDAAFRASAAQGKAVYGVARLANGDSAVWAVTAVEPGRLAALSAEERQQQHDAARDRLAMADAGAYVAAMRAGADVDINPQLFE